MNYDQVMNTIKLMARGDNQVLESIEQYISRLEKDKKSYLNQLLDTRHKLIQQDYLVENQKDVIENTRKALESYERENKHLRALVR